MSRLSVSFLPRSSILTVELLVASITPNRLMSNHFPLRPRRLIDLGVDAGRFGEALPIQPYQTRMDHKPRILRRHCQPVVGARSTKRHDEAAGVQVLGNRDPGIRIKADVIIPITVHKSALAVA
jgi:hypothetical protein